MCTRPRLNASFTRATIDGAIDEAVTKLDYSRASDDQVVRKRCTTYLFITSIYGVCVFYVCFCLGVSVCMSQQL